MNDLSLHITLYIPNLGRWLALKTGATEMQFNDTATVQNVLRMYIEDSGISADVAWPFLKNLEFDGSILRIDMVGSNEVFLKLHAHLSKMAL